MGLIPKFLLCVLIKKQKESLDAMAYSETTPLKKPMGWCQLVHPLELQWRAWQKSKGAKGYRAHWHNEPRSLAKFSFLFLMTRWALLGQAVTALSSNYSGVGVKATALVKCNHIQLAMENDPMSGDTIPCRPLTLDVTTEVLWLTAIIIIANLANKSFGGIQSCIRTLILDAEIFPRWPF